MDIQINNNIDDVKPKVMGPFTGLQLICVSIAAGIEMLGAFLIKSFFPETIICYIIPLPLALIPLAFGWAEDLLHMTIQDYWELVLKRKRTHPSFRPYKVHNYLENLEKEAIQEVKEEQEKAEGKQHSNKKAKNPAVKIPPELQRYE